MSDRLMSSDCVVAPAHATERVSPLLWVHTSAGWDRVLTPPLTAAEQRALSDASLASPATAEEHEEYIRWFASRRDLEFGILRLVAQITDEQQNSMQRLVHAGHATDTTTVTDEP